MYLSQLDVEGFRSLSQVSVTLGRDVSVLAGENNAGKSNVIDALRLLTDPVDGRRNLYLDRDDVFRGPSSGAGGAAGDLHRVGRRHGRLPACGQPRAGPPAVHPALYPARRRADPRSGRLGGRQRRRSVRPAAARPGPAAARLPSAAARRGPRSGIQRRPAHPGHPGQPAQRSRNQSATPTGFAIDQARLLDFVGSRFGDVEDHPVITAATSRISTRLSALTSGAYEQSRRAGLRRHLRAGPRPRAAGPDGRRRAGAARDRRVRHGLRQPAVHRDRAGAARRGPRGRPDAAAGRGARGAPAPAAAGPAAGLPARSGRGQPERAARRPVARLPPGRDHQPRAVARRLGRCGRPGHPATESRHTAAAFRPGDAAVRPQLHAVPAARAASDPAAAGDADPARYETAAINVAALGLPQADRSKLNRYLNATRSAMLFARG